MLSNFKYLNGTIWKNWYPKHTVPILVGKQATNCTNLISALALNGSSTTRDLAKFVLRNTSTDEYHVNPSGKDAQKLERRYYNLINGRLRKKTGRKKSAEKYPGLLEKGFIIKTGERRTGKRLAPLYFLTLKGCFFTFGFGYTDDEKIKFIENTASNHLFFAFVKEIFESINIRFVNEIILDPIKKQIEKGKIFLDEDIGFYFSNIAETIGNTVNEKLSRIVIDCSKNWPKRKLDDYPKFEYFEKLAELILFERNPRPDWSESITELFYPTDEKNYFYKSYSNGGLETNLLYKVMREIHYAHYEAFTFDAPKRSSRKIPHTSHWKYLQRIKQKKFS